MADYLGAISIPLPEGWACSAWSDEVLFFPPSPPARGSATLARYPMVNGFFVIEWAPGSDAPTSVPISGPYETLNAAIAAWKLMK